MWALASSGTNETNAHTAPVGFYTKDGECFKRQGPVATAALAVV